MPSSLRFEGEATGALNSKATGAGTYTGLIKYLGYNTQELITVEPYHPRRRRGRASAA